MADCDVYGDRDILASRNIGLKKFLFCVCVLLHEPPPIRNVSIKHVVHNGTWRTKRDLPHRQLLCIDARICERTAGKTVVGAVALAIDVLEEWPTMGCIHTTLTAAPGQLRIGEGALRECRARLFLETVHLCGAVKRGGA